GGLGRRGVADILLRKLDPRREALPQLRRFRLRRDRWRLRMAQPLTPVPVTVHMIRKGRVRWLAKDECAWSSNLHHRPVGRRRITESTCNRPCTAAGAALFELRNGTVRRAPTWITIRIKQRGPRMAHPHVTASTRIDPAIADAKHYKVQFETD